MMDGIVAGIIEALVDGFKGFFKFIGKCLRYLIIEILIEIACHFLLNWVGYLILKPFKKDIQLESNAALLTGLCFWIVFIIMVVVALAA